MINVRDLEVLSREELKLLAESYFNQIFVYDSIPSMQKQVKTARKNFAQVFSVVPVQVHTQDIYHRSNGTTSFVCMRKILGTYNYYSNGLVHDELNGRQILCDPWDVDDSDIQKRYQSSYNKCRLAHDAKSTRLTEEERLEAERNSNESQFASTLRQFSMMLVKYQYYKYAGKKFTVPVRFLIRGKKFYQVMDSIKQLVFSTKETSGAMQPAVRKKLMVFVPMLRKWLMAFTQFTVRHGLRRDYPNYVYNNRETNTLCRIHSYVDKEHLITSINQRKIDSIHSYYGYQVTKNELGHTDIYDIKYPEKDNEETLPSIREICETLYIYDALKKEAETNSIYLFKEFCIDMGFIPPEEESTDE